MRAGVQVALAAAGSLGPDQLVVVQCRSRHWPGPGAGLGDHGADGHGGRRSLPVP